MAAVAIVPGEAELGVQRRCVRCSMWWPADDREFWQPLVKRGHPAWHSWCRACLHEYAVARRARARALTTA